MAGAQAHEVHHEHQPAASASSAASQPLKPLAARYDAQPGTVYLFRPDGNVLARWRRADAQMISTAIQRCCEGATT